MHNYVAVHNLLQTMPECACTTHIISIFVTKHIFRHNFLFMGVQANGKIRKIDVWVIGHLVTQF